MKEQLPAVIILLPMTASFLAFFAARWARGAGYYLALAALSGCVVIAAALLYSVLTTGPVQYWMGGWAPPWGIGYRLDHLGGYVLLLVAVLSLFTTIYAHRTVAAELPDKVELFWCLYLLLTTGTMGIIVTGDLFNLFVLLEVASISGYALVAIGKGRAKFASFRYLIIGTTGACFYLLGVGYLYISTGSLNMEDLKVLLPPLYGDRVIHAAFAFMLVGLCIKVALFPLHTWQPDAYTYAPSAVSVIMSTAVAKTAAYALIRIVFTVFTIDFVKGFFPVFDVLCWIAAVAMLAGSIFANAQHNFKRMLAYSSIANVGYIVLSVGLAPVTAYGLNPALMHLMNHAVIKGCMFMAACAFIYKYNLWDIRDFSGLGRKMPFTCFALLLSILAMIGMPPSAGFVTKWHLMLAILDSGQYHFIAVVMVSTLLMLVYFWRLVEAMYIRPVPEAPLIDERQGLELPLSMLVPTVTLGVLTFVIGIGWMTGGLSPLLVAINANFGLGAP